jgi:class 3 adenylate cyclase/pimeloyl-ACP methyl ester carboxylesterase
VELPDDFPEPRYAKIGDLHIAYRVHGEGPFDLVLVPPWHWSIETFGVEPEAVAAFAELSSIARVIAFDKRGSGSSDPIVGAPTLEERMEDVRAVMDTANSSRAALVGVGTDGGALSILFAATFPERTFALALLWTTPRVAWAPDFPWGADRMEYERKNQELIANRLRGSMVEAAKEGAAAVGEELSTDEARRNARLARVAMSPGGISAYQKMNFEIDVRAVLPSINVPTLLVYSPVQYDPFIEEVTRYMHERIPVSEVVSVAALEDWFTTAVPVLKDFLPRTWAEVHTIRDEPRRVLATILFTDLVESSRRAAELGPRWQDVLREHNVVVRRELARYRGREIDTAGDGFFASGFDGPARAIRCACAIRDAVAALRLGIRIGVHTGECDLVDGKLSGLAVATGARVAAEADEGEVLVSGTVKDLVVGSGISFEPRGTRELKGLGEWPLYAVGDSGQGARV